MPKVSPIQSVFNAGEFSPLMEGRVDFDKYKNALRLCLNSIPLLQGGVARRPGSRFVAEVKESAKATRLVRFEFSTTQAYVVEVGDLYMRFYRDHAQIVSGTPVEIVTPYTEAQIFDLKFVQSADVLYIAHPSHEPRKLSRTSHTAWTLIEIDFLDGPFLATNATATTLTLGGTTGSVSVTASAVAGVNGGSGFQATDIGRLLRWKDPAGNWTWLKITARASTTQVTATIRGPNASAATATVNWRLGVWSDTDGFPQALSFFQDRLCWGGAGAAPDRIDGSRTGDYENMAPSDPNGTVTDEHAFAFSLRSNDVQVIRWLLDDEKGLLAGTVAGEWVLRPSADGEAVTPTNVNAQQSTTRGSANIQAVRAGKSALFVQRAERKLMEFAYVYTDDGFKSPDMTVLAEHITRGRIKEIAYQKEPQSVLWACLRDGGLRGLTYDREQDVVGWHRHSLGGWSDAGRTAAAKVESVAVIPSPDGARDELWLVVRRHINGGTKRYVEYLTRIDEEGDAQEDAFLVDCGLTYDGAPATTISGLTHLIGETVAVLADGATHPSKTVSGSGQIALDRSASVVQAGYAYNSDGQTLRINAGAADGTALGKTQRKHRVAFLLYRALGIQVGPSFDALTRLTFRKSSDDAGEAVPLFSGIKDDFSWPGDYSKDDFVCWRFDQPLPGTVLAVMPQMHTQDR